jgi:hypothetical protein
MTGSDTIKSAYFAEPGFEFAAVAWCAFEPGSHHAVPAALS